jgi:hypothetical protein
MWAKKRPHEWLGGVLGVLGLAPSTHISQIKQKVLKGYTFDSHFGAVISCLLAHSYNQSITAKNASHFESAGQMPYKTNKSARLERLHENSGP